jgi:peptidyl-prolyl cis-trans isomerase SurA
MHLLMVCDRQDAGSQLPTRDQVRRSLENRQFDLISRGYLRDLRSAAFVDIRL